MFKVGDSICYSDKKAENGVIFQGIVLEIKARIRISYHNTNSQEIIWVDASEIELQNTHQCSHKAECGWCDDTGKCLYD